MTGPDPKQSQTVVLCPQCNYPIPTDSKVCLECGVDIALYALLAEKAYLEGLPDSAPIRSTPPSLVPRIGEFLVNRRLISAEELETALKRQKENAAKGEHHLLGQTLIQLGLVDRKALDKAITEQIIQLHAALQESNRTLERRVHERTVELRRALERLSEVRISPTAPIVGENAFSHESGIHSHGVLERSDTFEPGIMTPEMVGHKRRIVLGKHTGKHAVEQSLKELGYSPNDVQLQEILQRIKGLGDKGKHVTDADLQTIAEVVIGQLAEEKRTIVLKELAVMTGNTLTPTATVKAKVRGEERVLAHIGVGPVDAALKAVRAILGEVSAVSLRDFRIEAITGGADALAEVVISVENTHKGRVVTARSAREDIVMASVEALINAINRLMLLEEEDS